MNGRTHQGNSLPHSSPCRHLSHSLRAFQHDPSTFSSFVLSDTTQWADLTFGECAKCPVNVGIHWLCRQWTSVQSQWLLIQLSIIPASIQSTFCSKCSTVHIISPVHHLSSPGLAWHSALASGSVKRKTKPYNFHINFNRSVTTYAHTMMIKWYYL